MPVFAVVSEHEEVREHDPHHATIHDVPGPHDDGIQDPPLLPRSNRQRAVAHVLPMSMSQVARDMAGRDPIKALETFDKTYNYNPEEGIPDFRWFASMTRESYKRKADDISRSECEVFAFLIQNTTSQQQAKKLIDIITNVSDPSNINLFVMNV